MNRRVFIRNSVTASGGILLMPSLFQEKKENLLSIEVEDLKMIHPRWLNEKWNANWIAHPTASLHDYGVFHFRKIFDITSIPNEFVIHVSGDTRFRLYVNGNEILNGPQSSDPLHWHFDTVDLARYLHRGRNVIAAVVWNWGEQKHLAHMSYRTAFILQGNSEKEEILNTNETWKILKNEAYTPSTIEHPFTSIGPGEKIDEKKYPFNWENTDYEDRNWETPKSLGKGVPYGKFTAWEWMLVPRTLPFMEHSFHRINEIRKIEGYQIDKGFLKGESASLIPANSESVILLDQTFLTNSYLRLQISGGKGATIEIGYAEALIDEDFNKGNRDKIENKHLRSAYWDIFKLDSEKKRELSTLWFRSFRYIELRIKTGENPLTLHDLHGYFTGYPFKEMASFDCEDQELKQIWEVGWRTARLCAGETYYDCPYYEQLQYVADTRIQALISLYVSGDDRLMRNALENFAHSLLPFGLTQSRYPSAEPQVIPPFSLFWIMMLYDFMMHREDLPFVRKNLFAVKSILNWYENQVDHSGMLGAMNWWNFTDWSFRDWNPDKPLGGVPEGGMEGHSSILSFQYARTLQKAAELMTAFGEDLWADTYRKQAEKIMNKTRSLCWDDSRGMIADTPDKKNFSQHANIMAVLAGAFGNREGKELIVRILQDRNITQATFYYKFYLFLAMKEIGLANRYLDQLQPWRDMLKLGLTTFAETPEPTRSDCHGWSASPVYDLLATVCGISPAEFGFKSVRIAPHPGNLRQIQGKVPHPKGVIEVDFEWKGDDLSGMITLPEGLTGVLEWKDKIKPLKSGKQKV